MMDANDFSPKEVDEGTPADGGFLAQFAPTEQSRVYTTLEDANEALRLMADSKSVDYLIDKPQPIENIIVHDAKIVDADTGVITYPTRCVVITPDGKAYHAISEGVLKSLQRLAQVNGVPPWQPPLVLQLLVTKTGRGQFKQLIPVKS